MTSSFLGPLPVSAPTGPAAPKDELEPPGGLRPPGPPPLAPKAQLWYAVYIYICGNCAKSQQKNKNQIQVYGSPLKNISREPLISVFQDEYNSMNGKNPRVEFRRNPIFKKSEISENIVKSQNWPKTAEKNRFGSHLTSRGSKPKIPRSGSINWPRRVRERPQK